MFYASLLCTLLASAAASAVIQLSAMNIDPTAVTVSGLSAGAFMAVQMHVAYSGTINGSAIFAGGPYYCAMDNLMWAEELCMYALMGGPQTSKLVTYTNQQAAAGTIDATSNLADDKVFLFSGSKDTVVNPKVMHALEDYYGSYLSSKNIASDFSLNAQHCLPTLNYGEQCDIKKSPYIGKCDYDGAGKAFQTMYGAALQTGTAVSSNLYKFDQTSLYPKGTTSASSSLDTTGYIYIPTACANGDLCKLHMSYHGCSQGQDFIGDQYAADTGFNTWAEANNIVVVYPYAMKNLQLGNGNGCFDWWGYTDSNYVLQSGVQMQFSKNILDTLMGV